MWDLPGERGAMYQCHVVFSVLKMPSTVLGVGSICHKQHSSICLIPAPTFTFLLSSFIAISICRLHDIFSFLSFFFTGWNYQ